MSGTDARRGFNFQDACTVSYILNAVDNPTWLEVQVEGMADIEDINVFGLGHVPLLRAQIKQKKDNDLWGPAELRKTLQAFAQYNDDPESTEYHFVYGGREGDDFVTVRRVLEKVRHEGLDALKVEQINDMETRFGLNVVEYLRRAGARLKLLKLGDKQSVRNDNVLRLIDMLIDQGHTDVTTKVARGVHDNVLLKVIEKTDDDNPYERIISRAEILDLLGKPGVQPDINQSAFSVKAYCSWLRRRTQNLSIAVPLYVKRAVDIPFSGAIRHEAEENNTQTATEHILEQDSESTLSSEATFAQTAMQYAQSVFVGEPGDGKSMSVWGLALDECSRLEAELEQGQAHAQVKTNTHVPVYISLAGYEAGAVIELVRNALVEAGQRIDLEIVADMARQGRLLILCDDLDLARADKMGQIVRYLLDWIAAYPDCSLIITSSRASDGSRLGLPTFRLLPLNDTTGEQILRQVTATVPLGLTELRAGLPEESHHLLTSPLTLRMVAELYVYTNGQVPRARSPLYQAAIDRFFELSELKGFGLFDRGDKSRILAALATWMQDNEIYSVTPPHLGSLLSAWISVGTMSGLAHLAGSDLLRLREELAHCGVLQRNAKGSLEFTHSTYRAFLAALTLEIGQLVVVLDKVAWRTSLVLWTSLGEQEVTDSLVELLVDHPILLGQVLRERGEKRRSIVRDMQESQEYFSRFFTFFSGLASQFRLILQGESWKGLLDQRLGLVVVPEDSGYVLVWHSLDDHSSPVCWGRPEELPALAARAAPTLPMPIWVVPIVAVQRYHPLELAYKWVLRSIHDLLYYVGWQGGLMVAEVAHDKGLDPAVGLLLNRFLRFHDLCTELPDELQEGLPFYATQSFDLGLEVHRYLEPPVVRFAVAPGHDPGGVSVSPTILKSSSDPGLFEIIGPNKWEFKSKEGTHTVSEIEEIELMRLEHMSPGQIAEGWLKKHLEERLYGYPPEAW